MDPASVVMDLQPKKFPERKLQSQETVRDSWKLKAKEIIIANCFLTITTSAKSCLRVLIKQFLIHVMHCTAFLSGTFSINVTGTNAVQKSTGWQEQYW